jgi:hypothetical protein
LLVLIAPALLVDTSDDSSNRTKLAAIFVAALIGVGILTLILLWFLRRQALRQESREIQELERMARLGPAPAPAHGNQLPPPALAPAVLVPPPVVLGGPNPFVPLPQPAAAAAAAAGGGGAEEQMEAGAPGGAVVRGGVVLAMPDGQQHIEGRDPSISRNAPPPAA